MKVLLVDDHRLFAKSLEIALEDYKEIESFVSTQDIDHIMNKLHDMKPDILLLDINLKNLNEEDGLSVAKNILKEMPVQKIVILTGYDLPVYRHEAQKTGARGFVNKNIEPEDLVKILERVMKDELCFDNAGHTLIEELTDSEKEILQLVAYGLKRKEIAAQLFISERTVSNHLQHIFDKLQVSSAVEAVTKAMQMGYIAPVC